MKKIWAIALDKSLEPDVKRKIRKVLKPDIDATSQPGKCIFCGEECTWRINKNFVCPRCSAKYGFVKEEYLPGPCEVCGGQGEWTAGEHDEHSLCFRHREAWFEFTRPSGLFPKREKLSDAEWHEAWEKIWARFVKEAKSEAR